MKLIDKDTLLVEIDKRKIGYNTDGKHTVEYNTVKKILDILDTIEVKEVDLEDEIDEAKDLAMRDIAWKIHVMICEGKGISEIDHYVCGICDF